MEEQQQVPHQPQHLSTPPLGYHPFNPSEEELLRYGNHHKTSGKRKFDAAAGGCSSQPSSKVPRLCDDGVGLSSSSMPTTQSHNSENQIRCYIDPDVWAFLEEVRELNSKSSPSSKISVSVPYPFHQILPSTLSTGAVDLQSTIEPDAEVVANSMT